MSDPLPPLPVPARPAELPRVSGVDASGVVVADRSCRQCGYNVRGLHVDRQCPECGTAVAVSARGDGLEFCEPKWVRKVSLGAGMLIVGPLLALLAIIGFLAFAVLIVMLLGNRSGNADPLFTFAVCTLPVAFLGGTFISYSGMWYVTAREPLAFESRQRSNSRTVVRLGLVMAIVSPVLQLIASNTTLPRAVEVLLILVNIPIALIGLYAVRQYYRWIGELARRLADAALESRCRMLSTWVPIGFVPPTAISMIETLTRAIGRVAGPATLPSGGGGGGFDAVMGIFGCATCFSSLLLFFLMFVALGAQSALRSGLREAARRARENWDLAMSGPQAANSSDATRDTGRR
ncbi:MAG: hypothetical protein ACKVS9_14845 [Phycisphaerae bacterium]